LDSRKVGDDFSLSQRFLNVVLLLQRFLDTALETAKQNVADLELKRRTNWLTKIFDGKNLELQKINSLAFQEYQAASAEASEAIATIRNELEGTRSF
jgi:hypothetical protein